ncbi:DUF6482 family protein [Salinicola aestuarinus]|uniref:DUF6482 family protein n=1 Tax=Salinicola aestuarinus TaxID=1949082 RepID=UPI000DA17723|nr:DUF6482 family protein [Salinicola aestuarinus]
MEIEELEHFTQAHRDYDVRIIAHAGSRYYQVMLEPAGGATQRLTRRGKPMMFRSLDDVYGELKRAAIRQAYLVHQVANDDVVGFEAHCRDPLPSRVSVVF